jgi:hypothetical protein
MFCALIRPTHIGLSAHAYSALYTQREAGLPGRRLRCCRAPWSTHPALACHGSSRTTPSISVDQPGACHLDAMRFEVGQLLEETGRRRPPTVPQDRRRRLAGRLAAMTVFGQADRFTAVPQPPPGTLKIADFPSDPEPDHPGRAATPEEFTEVLGTALFDAAADAAVGPMMAIASLNRTRGPESWGGDSEL